MTPTASAARILDQIALGEAGPLLDVRSEGEFAQGHFAGFANFPILNDTERHQVGLAYKVQGQSEAMRLGHELVGGRTRAERVETWRDLVLHGARNPKNESAPSLHVACWRGGLRSQIACEWLHEARVAAIRVEGGYKALRGEALRIVGDPSGFIVVAGPTGSGKTRLLAQLDVPKLDLEAIAVHRGSSFGRRWDAPQPSQATFENALAIALLRARFHAGSKNTPSTVVVEDESHLVGKVRLPETFIARIASAPLVVIEADLDTRIRHIFEEYVAEPVAQGIARPRLHAELREALLRVERRLGGAAAREILGDLDAAFAAPNDTLDAHDPWMRKLLERYYNRLYRHSFERQSRPIVHQGDLDSCRTWIRNRFV